MNISDLPLISGPMCYIQVTLQERSASAYSGDGTDFAVIPRNHCVTRTGSCTNSGFSCLSDHLACLMSTSILPAGFDGDVLLAPIHGLRVQLTCTIQTTYAVFIHVDEISRNFRRCAFLSNDVILWWRPFALDRFNYVYVTWRRRFVLGTYFQSMCLHPAQLWGLCTQSPHPIWIHDCSYTCFRSRLVAAE